MIEYTASTSKISGSQLYLNIFKSSSIEKPAYLDLTILEQIMKYNIKKQGVTLFRLDDDNCFVTVDKTVTLQGLLDHCEDTREFAKKYYPSLII